MILTALTAIWVVLTTCVVGFLVICISFLTRGGNVQHLMGRWWARSVLFVSRVKVTVEGLDHIDPCGTYVYMANHQSMYDILALLGYLPVQFRWLAKAELFRIPLFGYAMARVGYISIDRSNRRSALNSLKAASQKIARGVSVVIFPEGTRSTDGKVEPFKVGGFYLAIHSGEPIVPVVIYGTRHVLPKGSLRVRPGHIVVSIGSPVDTTSYDNKTKEVLMESVHSIMRQELEKIQGGQPESQAGEPKG